MVEDAAVSVLPYHPRRQEGGDGEAFAHGLGQSIARRLPPVEQRGLGIRWLAGNPEPRQDLMPDLPGEGALKQEVVHRLGQLVTEEAFGVVLESASCGPLGSPSAILIDQPVEKLNV